MNKFFNLVLVLLCLWVPGKAQIVEDTISLEAMITRAMSELDFSPVQSGIMLDSPKDSSFKTKLATCSLQLEA